MAAFKTFDSQVRLVRESTTSKSIKGKLYLGDLFLCSTLEPFDKAIPVGDYELSFSLTPNWSRFYGRAHYTYQFRLFGVPQREGILIHTGNTPSDSDGCILVGIDIDKPDFISSSVDTYLRLCNIFLSIGQLHGCLFSTSDQYLSFPFKVEVK